MRRVFKNRYRTRRNQIVLNIEIIEFREKGRKLVDLTDEGPELERIFLLYFWVALDIHSIDWLY
jgi:hypothetical protein